MKALEWLEKVREQPSRLSVDECILLTLIAHLNAARVIDSQQVLSDARTTYEELKEKDLPL